MSRRPTSSMDRPASTSPLFLTVLMILWLTNASAVLAQQRSELTPFVGFRVGGELEDTDTGERFDLAEAVSYGLIFDWNLDRSRQLEFLYSRQRTEFKTSGLFVGEPVLDVDFEHFQVGGAFNYGDERFRPFVAGTAGFAHIKPREPGFDSELRFSLSIGGGAKLLVSERVGFRFEARGYATFFGGNSAIFCSGGCLIQVNSTALFQLELFTGLSIVF